MKAELSIYSFVVSFLGGVLSNEMPKPTAYFPALGDETFDKVISQSDTSLVMFMAPWCGHCKKLHPEIEAAAEILKKKCPYPLLVAQVDCPGDGQKTCERHSITGYPTLKIFRGKKFWKEYDGPRTTQGIVDYMTHHSRPSPMKIAKEADLLELSSNDNAFVAFFKKGTKDSVLKDEFMKLAEDNRAFLRTGICEDPEMIEKYCPKQGVVFFRNRLLRSKFEPDEILYEGEESSSAMKDWLDKMKHGIVGLRTKVNVKEFPAPNVVAYYDVDFVKSAKRTTYWRNRVLMVAKDYKDDFTFAISSKYDFIPIFESFGIDFSPGLVKEPIILARTDEGRFKMNGTFTVEAFREFLEKLKNGHLKQMIKSEEPPEKHTGYPVLTVVATTFEDMVLKSGRDSFIVFYDANCRRCMKFMAVWYDLATDLKDEDIDILRMDYTKNSMPKHFHLQGTPFAIYWVPKNNKTNPIAYGRAQENAHRLNALVTYVSRYATVELKKRDRDGRLRKPEL